jgi:rhodanese-related sulfurtransferase
MLCWRQKKKEAFNLIDVRTSREIEHSGKIANAMEINLHELRDNVSQLNIRETNIRLLRKRIKRVFGLQNFSTKWFREII